MIIKTVSYWQKNIDLRNTIESSEINLHICRQLIYNKGAKNTKWKKLSLINGVGKRNETRALSYIIYKNELKMY